MAPYIVFSRDGNPTSADQVQRVDRGQRIEPVGAHGQVGPGLRVGVGTPFQQHGLDAGAVKRETQSRPCDPASDDDSPHGAILSYEDQIFRFSKGYDCGTNSSSRDRRRGRRHAALPAQRAGLRRRCRSPSGTRSCGPAVPGLAGRRAEDGRPAEQCDRPAAGRDHRADRPAREQGLGGARPVRGRPAAGARPDDRRGSASARGRSTGRWSRRERDGSPASRWPSWS